MPIETLGSPLLWAGFVLFVLAMLALDLGVFHRHEHTVQPREALIWSGVWIGLALLFGLGIGLHFNHKAGIEFITGYLIEKSLSIDNLFVFVVIFSAFQIPRLHQHRVLFWGILTALVLRAAMIFAGAALLQRFHWLMYVFGAFLIVTGVRLFLHRNEEDDPTGSPVLRYVRKIIPSTPKLAGSHFFVVENGRRLATPLLMALVLVEITDVIFALDSIPAIFAVTKDPFIVFTSNIFAIMGLRSLYFLLAGLAEKFTYLKIGLAAVLVFVGLKMTFEQWLHVPHWLSLLVIAAMIGASVVASILHAKKELKAGGAPTPAPKDPPRITAPREQ